MPEISGITDPLYCTEGKLLFKKYTINIGGGNSRIYLRSVFGGGSCLIKHQHGYFGNISQSQGHSLNWEDLFKGSLIAYIIK